MNRDTLVKKIEGKQKAVESLNKKRARIEAAKATNWEKNPYWYDEHDLIMVDEELKVAEQMLAKLKADLLEYDEKANSRNIPQMVEFLNQWKESCYIYYMDAITNYFVRMSEIREAIRAAYESGEIPEDIKAKQRKLKEDFNGYYELGKDAWGCDTKIKHAGKYEYARSYIVDNEEYAKQKLLKDLEAEYNRKYDFIIERTNAIVGQITDATNLTITNGELNGVIIGTRGVARVTTIGAGGYNIQKFHFRTLVSAVK